MFFCLWEVVVFEVLCVLFILLDFFVCSIAEWCGGGLFALAEVCCAVFFSCECVGFEVCSFVFAVTEWLVCGFATGAVVICLVFGENYWYWFVVCYVWFFHVI